MCGLFGFAATEKLSGLNYKNLAEWLHDAGVASVLRGEDSTGLGFVSKNKVSILKIPVASPTFFGLQRVMSELNSLVGTEVCIGHTRYATHGKVNYDNAHPFEVSNILLAHNGTLRSAEGLKGTVADGNDSRRLAVSLTDATLEENLDTLSQIHGAFALTWYNSVSKTLNLSRNRERTLWYALTSEKSALLWASESWMLTGLAARNNLTLDLGSLKLLPMDTVHIFSISDLSLEVRTIPEHVWPTSNDFSWTVPKKTSNSLTSCPYIGYIPGDEVEVLLNKWTPNIIGGQNGIAHGILVPQIGDILLAGQLLPSVVIPGIINQKTWSRKTKSGKSDWYRGYGKIAEPLSALTKITVRDFQWMPSHDYKIVYGNATESMYPVAVVGTRTARRAFSRYEETISCEGSDVMLSKYKLRLMERGCYSCRAQLASFEKNSWQIMEFPHDITWVDGKGAQCLECATKVITESKSKSAKEKSIETNRFIRT